MLVAWQQDTHLMTVLTSCHCEFISNPRQQKALTDCESERALLNKELKQYGTYQPKNP